mgnify:CR=1 FL=1|tara:strand:+ start:132 stop:368 length:237 start_codon:yes stop_codon:yes gene_type:complete
MINYKEITGVSVGEVHFTPEMVLQACKDSVKAAIPLILETVAEEAELEGDEGSNFDGISIDKKSITSLQDSLEKQLGI